MEREAWIIDGVRSPRRQGQGQRVAAPHPPAELLAQVLNALQDRDGFDTADVDDVVMGNGTGIGDHAMDIARMAVLAAGWPVEAPGVTLNRFCGSGQQAVTFAAMGVLAGHQDLVVGGGVESRCRVRRRSTSTASPPTTRSCAAQYPMVAQGISADLIATVEGFTREDVDAFAVDSQARAATAIAEGRFERSVVPIHNDDGTVALDHDEYPRPGTTMEGLAKLQPSFAEMGGEVLRRLGRTFDEMSRLAYPQIDDDRPRAPRRQLLGRRRRRAARAGGVARVRAGARPEAAGPRRDERGRRRRAGDHAHGARAGRAEVPEQGRHDRRRHRPVGDQRGVRRGRPRRPSATWASTGTRSTSTAARSRSATRSAPPAAC